MSTLPITTQLDIAQTLVASMMLFFFIFGMVGIAVGIGLILNPSRMHRFFRVSDQWISTRVGTRWLSMPRDIGPVVERFPRLIGATFIVLAAFSAFVLGAQLDVNQVVNVLHLRAPQLYVAWMVDFVRWCLVAGSMAAIAVGVMLIFFRDTLHAVEARANRWYSLRSGTQRADTMHMGFEKWVETYPRANGCVIAAAALIVVIDYGLRLFPHA